MFIIAGILFYGAILTAIGMFAYRKIKPLRPEKKKKIYIWSGVSLAVIVITVAVILIVSYFQNRILPTEEYLLGEWTASNENGEATIIFEKDNGEYTAEWSVYDYSNKEWSKSTFTIKDIDNHIMTILLDDGKIQFIPFAVSKDTLVFDGTGYTNSEKNVPIPDREYAYIVNGVILPIDKCYMGMSRDEVEKALDPLTVEHEKSWSTCELPEEYGNVRMEFSFHDEFGLKEIKYWLHDYYEQKNSLIDMLSDKYGDYEKSKWSGFDNYYRYTWCSGNLVIDLNEDIEEKQIWLEFSIDLDWELEYRRKNRD